MGVSGFRQPPSPPESRVAKNPTQRGDGRVGREFPAPTRLPRKAVGAPFQPSFRVDGEFSIMSDLQIRR